MTRGAQLLWAVPVVIAMRLLVVELPGDDISTGGGAGFWSLAVLGLTWAAAAGRSLVAWALLVAFAGFTLVGPLAIIDGYDIATCLYLALSGVALTLLLRPAARSHVLSSA